MRKITKNDEFKFFFMTYKHLLHKYFFKNLIARLLYNRENLLAINF